MEIALFLKNFAQAIEGLEENSLSPQTNFRKLPQWDSLALLSSLAMFDSEYQVNMTNEEIISCETLEELYTAIESKKN